MSAHEGGLEGFVAESNRIEGIIRPVTPLELSAHKTLLVVRKMRVDALQQFVHTVAGAPLRDRPGMNVRVGPHLPPPGGPHVREALEDLLSRLADLTPYNAHHEYETLHPFMDGNGRSGRALWLWMMHDKGGALDLDYALKLGFLHAWYYQSLQAGRAR